MEVETGGQLVLEQICQGWSHDLLKGNLKVDFVLITADDHVVD